MGSDRMLSFYPDGRRTCGARGRDGEPSPRGAGTRDVRGGTGGRSALGLAAACPPVWVILVGEQSTANRSWQSPVLEIA
jgi:hypothetical protein